MPARSKTKIAENILKDLKRLLEFDTRKFDEFKLSEETLDKEYKEKKSLLKDEKKKIINHVYGELIPASKALGIDLKSEADLLFYGEKQEEPPTEEKRKRIPKALQATEADEEIMLQ